MFAWYWLADLCAGEDIPFVLGHALYMKAIHGGKAKNDRIDATRSPLLLRGGMLPHGLRLSARACGRPATCCAAACTGAHAAAEAIAHIQNTNSQYNLPPLAKKLTYAANRAGSRRAVRRRQRAPQRRRSTWP